MSVNVSLKNDTSTINIEGITESVIIKYFQSINEAEFLTTASLFAEDGKLLAPFESPIIGRKAIAKYLSAEAKGMKLIPRQGFIEVKEDDLLPIKVVGLVQTSLFKVNVAWYFFLNQDRQIVVAKVKLLASPQELLNLNKFSPSE